MNTAAHPPSHNNSDGDDVNVDDDEEDDNDDVDDEEEDEEEELFPSLLSYHVYSIFIEVELFIIIPLTISWMGLDQI